MTDLDILKKLEDEVQNTLNSWPLIKHAIAYRYLFNLGIRIHDINRLISEGLKDENAKPKIGAI